MAAIRGKDTGPEVYLRKQLFSRGYRYRKNVNSIYGHPDIYLAKYHAVIFVNGCFWHRHHGCRYAYVPKSRTDFWQNKFNANIARDQEVRRVLAEEGLRQLVVWECTIRKMKKDAGFHDQILNQIEEFLSNEKLTYVEL